jgi:hypothetical protein
MHKSTTTALAASTPRWQAGALALVLATAALIAPGGSHAQSTASAASAFSALPLASVVVQESGDSVAATVSGASVVSAAVVAVPVALAVSGAVLVVKSIELGARGSVYVLERTSDGARVSLQISAGSVAAVALAVGSAVVVSSISVGTVLSAAGEVVAFLPNAAGRALLHHERISG